MSEQEQQQQPAQEATATTVAPAEGEGEKKISKSQLKKMQKQALEAEKKLKAQQEKAEREKKAMEQRIKEAEGKVLTPPEGAPEAIATKIKNLKDMEGKRVKVSGWCAHIRWQGKKLMFVALRDGTGYVQCVFNGITCEILDAINLYVESSITVFGTVKKDEKAPYMGIEIQVDYWKLVGSAPQSLPFNEEAAIDVKYDQRHLVLRGETSSAVMKLRSIVLQCFREHYFDRGYFEITPPTIVQTQCEGGSTLFKFNYFGEEAYLTQSSQLYLETAIPVVGDAFCIAQSYRAEKSSTPRHLSEYTHVEAERPFIAFEDLLLTLEDLLVDVTQRVFDKAGDLVKKINPKAEIPKRGFKRMTYAECIQYCRENLIYKDEETKTFFEFGEDIPDGPERKMIAKIGCPVMMMKFPAEMKAFYMKKCDEDRTLTESVDVLLPGVGEVIGGSMRLDNYEELMEGYKKEGVPAEPYYWYTDQRKFGSCPHGGYGLGLERYLMWLLAQENVKLCCLYPRFIGRAQP